MNNSQVIDFLAKVSGSNRKQVIDVLKRMSAMPEVQKEVERSRHGKKG
jgi:hypothetical protein